MQPKANAVMYMTVYIHKVYTVKTWDRDAGKVRDTRSTGTSGREGREGREARGTSGTGHEGHEGHSLW